MSLQSAIEQTLPLLRGEANARMTDTFVVYSYEWTKVDGLDERDWVMQYETPGRVAGRSRDGDTNTRTETVGGVERPVLEGGLHIPVSADLPAIGWELECVAVGASSDPSLLGRRWRVLDVPAKSSATARRLDVVDVTPLPEEA